jgi:putative restriction endonuclease
VARVSDHRADLSNVLALSKTHHAAFHRALLTINREYRLRVNPAFNTNSDVLQRTILNRAEERISVPEASLDPEYIAEHNATLAWV